MGSRRGRYAALVLVVSACTAGAPTGFSGGDHWSVPLIGPLEDGLLLVPVFVNGAGPYVFAVDPDANVSIVDEHVVKQSKMRVGEGPHLLDESDTSHPHFYAEVLSMEIGTLSIERKSALVVKDGTYDTEGRTIDGVLGRDVIADSLVFGFDRDQGVLTLTTKWLPDTNGTSISFETMAATMQNTETPPPPRRLVKAKLNGQTFTVHADFGAKLSQLRERSWAKAGLTTTAGHAIAVDETGFRRDVTKFGTSAVELGTLTAKAVTFAPYDDKRWPDEDLEGALGLDFWLPYSLQINWDKSVLVAKPRGDVKVATRIGRWQSKTLSECKHAGCVNVTLIDPLAKLAPDQPKPAVHPGVVATIARDDSAEGLLLEATVAMVAADGKPLQWLVVNLTGTAQRAMIHLPGEYAGATAVVVDASEFPRTCPNNAAACIDRLAPGSVVVAGAAPVQEAPKAVAPAEVETSALKRKTGDEMLAPGDAVKAAMIAANYTQITGDYRVCIDPQGAVETVEMIDSSRIEAFDQQAMQHIRSAWTFEPYAGTGAPIHACAKFSVAAMNR